MDNKKELGKKSSDPDRAGLIKVVRLTKGKYPEEDKPFEKPLLEIIKAVAEYQKGLYEEYMERINAEQKKKTYMVSSLFLQDCYDCLTRELSSNKDIESLIYVTGVEAGRYVILDRIISFKMDEQTPVYAKGNAQDTHRVLMQLSVMGYKLLGIFHTHLWEGMGAVNPSSIDITNQGRYEKSGYEAISGIFSKDGFVRFFSNSLDFNMTVYGKEVQEYGNKIYRFNLRKTHC